MKKILTLSICLLFIGVTAAAATPALTPEATKMTPTFAGGMFVGSIGYKRQGENATIVGTINGTYEMRARGGRFNGEWATENRSGTLRGRFARHYLIGRVTLMVNGTERNVPIVGFLRAVDGQFIGRFMAPVGPALYFWGDYT